VWHVIGQTITERHALFNNCKIVSIHRDCDHNGRTIWKVFVGHDYMGGFEHGRNKTRKEAITFALSRYPSLEIVAQYGDSFRHIQSMNQAVKQYNRES
jgi:hypothetical protein